MAFLQVFTALLLYGSNVPCWPDQCWIQFLAVDLLLEYCEEYGAKECGLWVFLVARPSEPPDCLHRTLFPYSLEPPWLGQTSRGRQVPLCLSQKIHEHRYHALRREKALLPNTVDWNVMPMGIQNLAPCMALGRLDGAHTHSYHESLGMNPAKGQSLCALQEIPARGQQWIYNNLTYVDNLSK